MDLSPWITKTVYRTLSLVTRPVSFFLNIAFAVVSAVVRFTFQSLSTPLNYFFSPLLYILDIINRNKWKWILSILLGITLSCLLLATSIATYSLLYYNFMPDAEIRTPVYFNYEEGRISAKTEISEWHFYEGQEYEVFVEIDVPETEQNHNIGIFMINTTLIDSSTSREYNSVRPSMLHYKSYLLRILWTLFYSFPLLLGVTEEKQHLSILLFDSIEKFTTAFIEVSKSELQIYSASLFVRVKLYGLRYICYNWFLSSFVFGTFLIFVLEGLLLLILFFVVKQVREGVEELAFKENADVNAGMPWIPPPAPSAPELNEEEFEQQQLLNNHSTKKEVTKQEQLLEEEEVEEESEEEKEEEGRESEEEKEELKKKEVVAEEKKEKDEEATKVTTEVEEILLDEKEKVGDETESLRRRKTTSVESKDVNQQ